MFAILRSVWGRVRLAERLDQEKAQQGKDQSNMEEQIAVHDPETCPRHRLENKIQHNESQTGQRQQTGPGPQELTGALKELIHEEFGDGIMSAINFKVDIARREHPDGDRVVVTFDGKFLDYRW